eukprot:scaffold15904_cov108-Isochrysis_galbana.AAC.2
MVGAGQTPPESQARGGTWRTGPCGPATSPPPPPSTASASNGGNAATQASGGISVASQPLYTTTG